VRDENVSLLLKETRSKAFSRRRTLLVLRGSGVKGEQQLNPRRRLDEEGIGRMVSQRNGRSSNAERSPLERITTRRPGVERAGDDHHGFELTIDKSSHLIHMVFWGMWDLPIAEAFRYGLLKLGGQFSGEPWGILVDSRRFMAQSPEVTQIRQEVMTAIGLIGCKRIAAIVDAPVYTMQFKRISASSNMKSQVFQDEKSALVWLRQA